MGVNAIMNELRAVVAARRLHPGKGILGPEYSGCCGTGRRPRLRRNLLGEYIAGPELGVDRVSNAVCFGRTGPRMEKLTARHRRIIRMEGCVLSKTRKPAARHFLKLCEDVVRFNAQVAQERRAARRDMRARDVNKRLAAMLRYADTI